MFSLLYGSGLRIGEALGLDRRDFPEAGAQEPPSLVITGKDYVVNGKYSIESKQVIFVAPEIRTVLEEIEEQG